MFHDHCFQRAVAAAFADPEEGTVDGRRAVEPCGRAVGNNLIEVVVAVPFEHFGRYTRIVGQTVHDALYRAGQCRAGIGYAVAHRVARTDFDGDAVFFGQVLKSFREGNHKTVEVRAGNIFKVAAG